MDSDGKRGRVAQDTADVESSLLRAVSFPNFLRGFWEHSHQNSPLSESSSSSTLSLHAEHEIKTSTVTDIPPGQSEPTWPTADGKLKRDGEDTSCGMKLMRRDTWACFSGSANTAAETSVPLDWGTSGTIQQQSVESETVTETHGRQSVMAPASQLTSSASASSVPVLASGHRGHSASSRLPYTRILAALFMHDMGHVELPDRPIVDAKGSVSSVGERQLFDTTQTLPDEHHDAHDRSGIFGLPSRVKVSGREINMMTPISF